MQTLESKSGNQTVDLFQVNNENVDKAPEDITVTFVKDDAAIATDAGLILLPSSVLTFSSGEPSVKISKGSSMFPAFQSQINTGTLDPAESYGLAFTIKSVSKAGIGIFFKFEDGSLKNLVDELVPWNVQSNWILLILILTSSGFCNKICCYVWSK